MSKLPPRMKHKFKLRNNQLEQSSIQLDAQIQLMSNNLMKVQRQLTEQEDHESCSDHQMRFANQRQLDHSDNEHDYRKSDQSYEQQENNEQENQQHQEHEASPQQILKEKYQSYLNNNKFSSNYEQKINKLLDSEQQSMSIGNAIALFEMVFYFRQILTQEVLNQIQSKAFQTFAEIVSQHQENQTKQDKGNSQSIDSSDTQLLESCLSQLIAICGVSDEQTAQFFTQYLLQNPTDFKLPFKVLINMPPTGILTLLKILNQDLEEFTPNLLQHLSNSQFIIQKILLPHLLNDLTNSTISSKDKNTALTVLISLGEAVNSEKLTQTLVSLFKSNTIDKNLLISGIKATGKQQGQKILINLLHQPNLNEEIAIFIIKCLSEQNFAKNLPQIIVSDYPISNLFQMNKLYFYEINVSKEPQTVNEVIYLNPRMLCSSLQKLALHIEHNLSSFQQSPVRQLQSPELFVLPNVISNDQQEKLPNLEIVHLFLNFTDKNFKKTKIKEAAIEALGKIQLPENPSEIIQKLTLCLQNTDPSILSSACLTLSKIDFIPSPKLINKLSELLRNNYWKVRISACQTIGHLLRQAIQSVIEILVKCLKDGSINRQLVCQTMIKIHPLCKQLLLQILKETKDSKIQQIILCSFNQPQILHSQNLPTIIQTIFEFSNSQRKQFRYICIGVVNSLRKYSEENHVDVSYFKSKNILPFYYNFLHDSCQEIRDLSLSLILDFGSYAQLVLIEGMTKGRTNCRIQCAKGLGLRGIQNFRALLLGMRDLREKVRTSCCDSILDNFELEEIFNEYKGKSSQCISLIYNIKDLLAGNTLNNPQIKMFLRQLIERLSEESNIQMEGQYLDEQEQIQKEINEFRQSMKMRKDQPEDQNEDEIENGVNDENRNPNVIVSVNQKGISKGITQKTKTQGNPPESKPQTHKRYYFKLNETIA